MNTYSDTQGNRYTTAQIDRKSDITAKQLLLEQLEEFGYNFCTKCRRNDDKPIDVSHTIGRNEAKKKGNVEVLWDKSNQEILGRKCHKEKDKLNLF